MNRYFVSDMHFSENRPDLYQAFFSFLKQHHQDFDELYLLGDIFEYWIGDDHIEPMAMDLANKLRELSIVGKRIYLMHGNRDFMFGERFAQLCGARILKDPTKITVGTTKVWLCHGDALCTSDWKYQIFRTILRNRLLQNLFLRRPLKKRLAIAEGIRSRSKTMSSIKTESILDVSEATVRNLLARNQCSMMIHGHTHRPNTHNYLINGKNRKRFVLGDWDGNGAIIGRFTLTDFELFRFSASSKS